MKYVFIIVSVLVIIGAGMWLQYGAQKTAIITNFEECAAAGNPVMESYPRQCADGNKTYMEDIVRVPTSADNAPPGSIHNLPVPDAVSAVRAHVAQELGIDKGVVIIMSAYEKEWPDACLGLASSDEMCAQVITSGYEVTAQAQGAQFTYRTNANGTVLRKQ
jgi:hypothetical protein